jgi:hypothetical protein
VSNALLILWIALIGADRIDLAGGAGPFLLTPFLTLTPFVAFSELMRRHLRGRAITVPSPAVAYLMVVTTLLVIVLTSVFAAQDLPTSASRAFLLVGHVSGTFVVALLAADRDDLKHVLSKGALLALAIFVVFDAMEALWWLDKFSETLHVGTVLINLGNFQSLGEIPRLPGPVADANRAGLVLLVYGALIVAGERRAWVRRLSLTLITVLLLATISRSALLGAGALIVMSILTRRSIPAVPVVAAVVVMAALTAYLLTHPRVLEHATAVAQSPLGQHLSGGRGSASGHVELIERGFVEATSSVPRSLIGLGFGNSFLILQDVFPGNRYGNFHSLYVTMFAESGIFALLLTLVLLSTPMIGGGPWRPVVAAAILFNVFYQTTSEPVFWYVLAVAWMTIPVQPKRAAIRALSAAGT